MTMREWLEVAESFDAVIGTSMQELIDMRGVPATILLGYTTFPGWMTLESEGEEMIWQEVLAEYGLIAYLFHAPDKPVFSYALLEGVRQCPIYRKLS